MLERFHEDARGRIEWHNNNGVLFNVVFTKKGMLRGGDMHNNTQFNFILSGEVEVISRQQGENKRMIRKARELITISPGIPHLFKFNSDTLMLEWWDGPFEIKYYEPYRKIVEEQFQQLKGAE